MKCPKCGTDIPFYDIRPNCKNCGVNILYYAQDYQLERDAKRTELENASMRMVVARIKAVFIGSLSAIFRMIFIVLAICSLMIPFAAAEFRLPFYEEKFSVGLISVIQSFSDFIPALPGFLKSALFSDAAAGTVIILAFFALLTVIDAVLLVVFLLSFLNPVKSAKKIKKAAVIACVAALCAQAAVIICTFFVFKPKDYAEISFGFGAAVSFIMHLVLLIINSKMLKKGIEPVYREFDPKRKELLKKVRKGEIDLDELTLPVFESEEEYNTRMSEFEQAMQEESAAELENEVKGAVLAGEEADKQ